MHPHILFAHSSSKWTTKTCSAPPFFTKVHPFYHFNSTQPDYAMWQSLPFKSGQPYADTCHNPPLTKLTNQILPCHHLPKWNPNPNFLLSFHHHGSRHPCRQQSFRPPRAPLCHHGSANQRSSPLHLFETPPQNCFQWRTRLNLQQRRRRRNETQQCSASTRAIAALNPSHRALVQQRRWKMSDTSTMAVLQQQRGHHRLNQRIFTEHLHLGAVAMAVSTFAARNHREQRSCISHSSENATKRNPLQHPPASSTTIAPPCRKPWAPHRLPWSLTRKWEQ